MAAKGPWPFKLDKQPSKTSSAAVSRCAWDRNSLDNTKDSGAISCYKLSSNVAASVVAGEPAKDASSRLHDTTDLILRQLHANLPEQPPSLVVSDTDLDKPVWVLDGKTLSTEAPMWVVDGSSLQVELDATNLDQSGDALLDFQDLFATALERVVGSDVSVVTLRLPSTTTASIEASIMHKQVDSTDDPALVVGIAVAALATVLLLAGVLVVLVWFLCRHFRKVNIFTRRLAVPGSKIRTTPTRVISVGSKRFLGPTSKRLTRIQQSNAASVET